jgi:hypothetical protein
MTASKSLVVQGPPQRSVVARGAKLAERVPTSALSWGRPKSVQPVWHPFFIRFGTGCVREAQPDGRMADAVVTAGALEPRSNVAEFLVAGKQAHYLLTVKANQRALLARCQRLPRHRVPVRDTSRDRGRIEHRTLKAVTVHHFGFPYTAQVLQLPIADTARLTIY